MMKKAIIIFSAGKGSRLHPYTLKIPKSLLKVFNNKSILELKLDQLRNEKPQDIFINISYAKDLYLKILKKYKDLNINLLEELEPLGQGKTLLSNINTFKKYDILRCTNADTYTVYNVDMAQSHINENNAFISLHENGNTSLQKNILTDHHNHIIGIEKRSGEDYFYDKILSDYNKVNAIGEYYINPISLKELPNNQEFIGLWGENDLIELLIKAGHKPKSIGIKAELYKSINTIEEYNNFYIDNKYV